MQYRTFGKTGENISVLGFGCMRLPIIDNDTTHINESEATALLHHAIDSGVNYVDTAYPYHGSGFSQGGQSELFVARALKNGYREKVNLATKLPTWLIKTREDMDRYLNEQLERLETDKIDFYLLHSLNRHVWPLLKELGVNEFLDTAIKDGRIRYAGFSYHDDDDALFQDIVDYYDWSFCQIQYNYVDENFQAGTKGLEYAAATGMGIIIMEPLRGGNLVRLPQDAQNLVDSLEEKRTPAELAFRWVWNNPKVSVVLSGMGEMSQLTENLQVAQTALPNSLSEKDMDAVNSVKKIFKDKIKVNCTGCCYCMPCPVGINIPRAFSNYNDHWVFDGAKSAKYFYLSMARAGVLASACVECGQCETHCPQNIEIRKELKNVVKLFES